MTLPALTSKRVLQLAVPIMLSNVSVPLLGVVDTAVVGHLPDPRYIAAVAVGAMIFSFVFWLFGFLKQTTTGFIAQAYGRASTRPDDQSLTTLMRTIVLLGLGVGVLLICLQVPIAWVAFWLYDLTPAVEEATRDYYNIRIWSAPATLISFAALGCFIGLQRTKIVLLLQLFLNLLNILLDLLFVLGFGWGVGGVALASVIAEYATMSLALYLLRDLLWAKSPWRFEAVLLKQMLGVNLNMMARTFLMLLAFSSVQKFGEDFGTVTLAANAVLMQYFMLMAYFLDGFSHTAESLAGKALGQQDRQAYQHSFRLTQLWAGLFACGIAVMYATIGTLFLPIFTSIPEVLDQARAYFIWVIILPPVGFWAFHLDGIFIGAIRSKDMRNAMIVSVSVYALALWILLPLYGNHGLWAAFTLFIAMRGITLGVQAPLIARSIGSAPAKAAA